MTKNEFLSQLSKRLTLISEQERNDILDEYSAYIDDKMADGSTEEQAVAGFGDVNELAKEILEAYKINMDSFTSKTNKTLDQAFEKAQGAIQNVGHLSFGQIVHLLIDAFLILIVLSIGRFIVVDLICNLFVSLILSLGDLNTYTIERVVLFLMNIGYFIVAMWLFIETLKRRYQRYRNENRQQGVIDDMKETWHSNTNTQKQPLYHERSQHNESGNIIIKIILCLLGFPVLCAIAGFAVVIVLMIFVAITKQAISFGLFMIMFGLLGGGISILLILMHIWPRKEIQDA